ncbi:hemin uptake protein HemP [Novispirillum itersonii]|uniref:Hemin uptake protein HemP n=1 Tax=Novispirillum itersonii TaxID=189 RepID=A0A7X0DNP8_NOVIT|nr:hemin uptake protein HemP [Novispirillum itersonii]MBB6212373.1 hemin uptake protein HemP [Novispirillum itersonii]
MTSSFPAETGPEQMSPDSGADAPPRTGGTAKESSGAGSGLIRLTDLLGARREIGILHGDAVYTLRLTSNNRLILTK